MSVVAVTRFRVGSDLVEEVGADVDALLSALAGRPGFRSGVVGRAAEDAGLLALVTTWDGVGAYRRALSAAEVKIAGAPVWQYAIDEPGVYLSGPG